MSPVAQMKSNNGSTKDGQHRNRRSGILATAKYLGFAIYLCYSFFLFWHYVRFSSWHYTVVVQNDVPTTDLSKNGKLKKRMPERAGKPVSSAKPWRTPRRRCQLDLVARTPTIKYCSISSLFRTPFEACERDRGAA